MSVNTVLVVDDELFFRSVLKDILTRGGFSVVAEASSGEEAILKYRELSPSVVLMDIYMDGENGIDATKDIMALDPASKILVCSGSGFDDDINAVMHAGAKGVIFKPFFDDEVLEKVRELLEN